MDSFSGKLRDKKGFTLIELIIVIAIIAILAAAIFVAVDPARRLHEARNARRRTDVATYLEAIKQNQVDNGGDLLSAITDIIDADEYAMIGEDVNDTACAGTAASPYTSGTSICGAASGAGSSEQDCVDIAGNIGSNYLSSPLYDPEADYDATDRSEYWISYDDNGAVTIGACDEEGEGAGGNGTTPVIELSR